MYVYIENTKICHFTNRPLEHQQWASQMPNCKVYLAFGPKLLQQLDSYTWDRPNFFGIVLQCDLICEIALQRYAIQKKFILIAHSRSTSLSLFLHYRVLLSLAPSSFSLSLAFLSDHQATVSPSLAFLSDHQAAVRITKPLPLPIHPHPSPNLFSLSPSLAFLSDHQAAVTKPRFSLRSPSRCPNHQASADSPKLRRSLK